MEIGTVLSADERFVFLFLIRRPFLDAEFVGCNTLANDKSVAIEQWKDQRHIPQPPS